MRENRVMTLQWGKIRESMVFPSREVCCVFLEQQIAVIQKEFRQ